MNNYQTSLRDIDFVLYELLDYESHCAQIAQSTLDRELVNAFLAEAARFAEKEIAPLNSIGDLQGCQLMAGQVTTPKGFKEAYLNYCAAGWPGLMRQVQYGGQGLPQSLGLVISEVIGTPNWAWGMYSSLSKGAMYTLEMHGTSEQKSQYLPHLISGDWTGTMCLTEAHAGSDLGLLRTKAVPQRDGSYKISGNKIFISAGDHDFARNIIHIVLARLPDAPEGTKGISLFVVPKMLSDAQGQVTEPNGVSCISLEHKMGIHGNATCSMHFDEAQGWLLGDLHKGLPHMFTFMNLARLGSALQGLAHAEVGYQKARDYARERLQMRSLSGVKNPKGEADPIMVHPDVRRMLLTQKALLEGQRMLIYYASQKLDISAQIDNDEASQVASQILGVLTPIAKAFSTEAGFESANLALQCFGGHGYIRDWGLEQNLRDCRIATLYEGTTGIQALDLLGRKLLGDGGQALTLLTDEIELFCQQSEDLLHLNAHITQLAKLNQEWQELTAEIAQKARQNPDEVGAAAVDFLMYSGYVLLAYLWARGRKIAYAKLEHGHIDSKFYKAKLATADFYFARILPRTQALSEAIRSGADNLMSLPDEYF